jgi:hypothetical protein
MNQMYAPYTATDLVRVMENERNDYRSKRLHERQLLSAAVVDGSHIPARARITRHLLRLGRSAS